MFFKMILKTGSQNDVDEKIPEEIRKSVPENIELVYWDYYHHEEEHYNKIIKQHLQFYNKVVFAGGIWKWFTTVLWYGKTFKATIPELKQCMNNNVRDIIATMWDDNDAECNITAALFRLQLYAEFIYSSDFTFTNSLEKDK